MKHVIFHDFQRWHSNLRIPSSLSSVQSLSDVQIFVTPWTAARQVSLSFSNSQSLLKLLSIQSVMPSNHLILCCPLLFLFSIFPSIRIFSSESGLHIRRPNIVVSTSTSVLPIFRTDFFRMECLYLLAAQGTLKSLLQHHSSKTSVLRHSAFFIVQLTSIHDYSKTHSLD